MWRVCFYIRFAVPYPELTRCTSNPFESRELADQFLDKLSAITMDDASPLLTGGGIEVKVPGVGWVIEDEAESVVYNTERGV